MSRSVVSLDSASDAGESYDSDEDLRLAQEEWEESLEQLQQLVSIVLLPFFGKWLGRRWSHWGMFRAIQFIWDQSNDLTSLEAFARYLRLGLGKSFFLGQRSLASSS